MYVFLLILFLQREPFWGGSADCPILIKIGSTYNYILKEIYWSELFDKKTNSVYTIKNTFDVYGEINFVLFRMLPQNIRYAKEHAAFLELQEFLFPKGVYLGYYGGRLKFYGYTPNNDTITQYEITPGGLSLGIFMGKLPVYPYISLIGAASFVEEGWHLKQQIDNTPIVGGTKSTGFIGMLRFGILWQIKSKLAADISIAYNYFTLQHSTLENIPRVKPGQDKQIIQNIKFGFSLAYAWPWRVVTEVHDKGAEF